MSAVDDPAARFADTLALAQERIGPGLRSLMLFGSCLSMRTRHATSIPDLFALVDDVDDVLARMEVGRVTRWAARLLPPITLSLRSPADGAPLAKLNLIAPERLRRELASLRDLYLAGRLSKRVVVARTRDPRCAAETAVLLDQAARAMAGVALLGRPRHEPIATTIERCVTISYDAEPRPESPQRVQAVFDTFAAHYEERFRPLVEAEALRRGLSLRDDALMDERSDDVRSAEARALARLLRRSRLRMMARWPKQALVYRGWLPYLLQKLRRARLAA